MKSLADQMAFYQAYHHHPHNRATHFIGVPMIIIALLIPMAWVRIPIAGFSFSLALLFSLVVLTYYFLLDWLVALGFILVYALLFAAGEYIGTDFSMAKGGIFFAGLFFGGWALQLIGHGIEGRRPALVDNFLQIFIAPLFLFTEILFSCGFRPDLKKEVLEKAKQHRPSQ